MKARKLALLLGFGLCFSASTLFAEMYKENVVASFYADKFNGRRTASGEIFDTNGYTAAHKTLPFGTVLKVTNLDNGKAVKVRINDRGPFVQGREIDVSKAAAIELDMVGNGTAKVSLEIVDGTEGPVASKTSSAKSSSTKSSSSSASSGKTAASQPAPAPVSASYDDEEEEEEDDDVYYTSYDDEEEDEDGDYSTASSGSSGSENTGFSFGGASPFSSGLSSSDSSSYYADDEYADEEEEEEEDDEPLPPPPPPKKETVSKKEPAPKAESAGAVKKETKTVTTTTTTTTTVVEETSAKRWDIQLGAYTNEGNAKVMAHRLLQAGFDNVAYQKVGNIIRVVLRDIDEADLDKFQSKLDETGFGSYIVRERKNIIKKD